MINSEQVRRNEQYLRQTEARDYEEFAGLYEEEPEYEPDEEKAGLSAPPKQSEYKEHIMFKQNMQQERTWQAAAAEIVTHIMRLYNVDADRARKLFRDALDTTSVWTEIMRLVAHDVEWQQADEEEKLVMQERIRKEAKEAAREDAYYAKLRGG